MIKSCQQSYATYRKCGILRFKTVQDIKYIIGIAPQYWYKVIYYFLLSLLEYIAKYIISVIQTSCRALKQKIYPIIKHSKAINYCPLIINVIPHPLTRSHTLQSLSHSTNPSPSLTSSSKASGALWCAALMMSWRQRANSSMTSRMGSASRRSASSLLSTAAAMRHWHTASITSEVMKLHGCLLKTKLDYVNNKSYVKLKRFKFKIFSLLFLQCHIHVWRYIIVTVLLWAEERYLS